MLLNHFWGLAYDSLKFKSHHLEPGKEVGSPGFQLSGPSVRAGGTAAFPRGHVLRSEGRARSRAPAVPQGREYRSLGGPLEKKAPQPSFVIDSRICQP